MKLHFIKTSLAFLYGVLPGEKRSSDKAVAGNGSLKDSIFSGNVIAICTEENYALVKSWIPESVRIPKVKF